MSQHDMDIANQSFAATRADLNLALVALVSTSSGATAPATTFAYMWWADTANDLLKQRNAANSAWISVQKLSTGMPVSAQQIQPITGSVSANALTLTLNPTSFDFRNASLGSGAVSTVALAAAVSMVVPSGATLGTANAKLCRLAVLAINNAGTMEVAVCNASSVTSLDETALISTTAVSAGATSAGTIYSTTARSNVAFRIAGFIESTQATAGTWATAPSTIQGAGGEALADRSVAFSAYQTSLTAAADATFTKVALQAEEYDNTASFDSTTNYRFTAPRAGFYQLEGSCAFGASETNPLVSIYKNGARYKDGNQAASAAVCHVACQAFLNAGDYIELFVYQNQGSSQNTSPVQTSTYLQGCLLAGV